MNWQELLIRFLVSGAAGAASTGALVMSAENPPKVRKKRKRRRRRRRRPGDPPPKVSRKQKRAREKRRREVDASVADPGRMASRHLAEAAAPGMTTDEFITSLKDGGRSMRDGVGRMFGLVGPKPEAEAAPPKRDRPVRGAERSTNTRRGRRPKQTRQDGLEALKQDVMYLAKDKVKQKVVEATGVGEGVERIKDVAEEIGERAGDVGRTLSDVARDGAGRLGETAGSVRRNAGELASSVQKALPEDVEDVSHGMKGIGRWLQGPGAQNYDGERRKRELPAGAPAPKIVEAKIADDDAPRSSDRSPVQRLPSPPEVPNKASPVRPGAVPGSSASNSAASNSAASNSAAPQSSARSSSAPGRSAPGRSLPAEEAGPFRPAQELAVHAPEDDERWTAIEPGRPPSASADLAARAPVDAEPPNDADRPNASERSIAAQPAVSNGDDAPNGARAEGLTLGDGPRAGETVDAELLPAPSAALEGQHAGSGELADDAPDGVQENIQEDIEDDIVEARIDDDVPPPVRRHRG